MLDGLEDKNLIQQYLKGDERSLEVLVKKYMKPIYGFVYKNVGNIAAAEDITQEVFVKIWKNIRKFDQNKNFKPWIFQIAKNTSIDFLRKKKSIPFSRFENEKGQNILTRVIALASSNILEKLSDQRVLAVVMQDLTESERKIINMRYSDGLSFREIAETFKESINTVKSKHHRLIEHLRKITQKNRTQT